MMTNLNLPQKCIWLKKSWYGYCWQSPYTETGIFLLLTDIYVSYFGNGYEIVSQILWSWKFETAVYIFHKMCLFFWFDACLDTNCKHRRQTIVFLHEHSLSVQCFDSLLALFDFRLDFQCFSPGTLNYMYTYLPMARCGLVSCEPGGWKSVFTEVKGWLMKCKEVILMSCNCTCFKVLLNISIFGKRCHNSSLYQSKERQNN